MKRTAFRLDAHGQRCCHVPGCWQLFPCAAHGTRTVGARLSVGYNLPRKAGDRFYGTPLDGKYACCGYTVCSCATPAPAAPVQAAARTGWARVTSPYSGDDLYEYTSRPGVSVYYSHAGGCWVSTGVLVHETFATRNRAMLAVEREFAAATPAPAAPAREPGELRVGDRVRCVNVDQAPNLRGIDTGRWHTLELGRVYTASKVYPHGGGFEIQECDGCSWSADRFELVTDTVAPALPAVPAGWQAGAPRPLIDERWHHVSGACVWRLAAKSVWRYCRAGEIFYDGSADTREQAMAAALGTP